MSSYLTLAIKELKKQRVMAFLILAAVILSSTMTTVVSSSVGILNALRIKQAAGLNGNRYATFHQLSKEQAKALHSDSRLYDVGDVLNLGNVPLGNSGLSLFLREYHQEALTSYPAISQLEQGRLPEKPGELALPSDALGYLGQEAAVGDVLSLPVTVSVMDGSIPDYSYTAQFTLTGILKSSYLGYASGTVDGIVGGGTGERLLPEEYLLYSTDFKTIDKGAFQATVYDLSDSLQVEERCIQYNWLLLNALGISYEEASGAKGDRGFSFMTLSFVLVGALVLLAAGLVIYNILKISVAKSIKEFGTLRAIGGERGQLYRLVTLKLGILCGIGIPLGLLLGVLASRGILTAALSFLNPEIFLADSTSQLNSAIASVDTANPAFLFLGAAVTLIFAMLAAFPAARYASHVSPTAALAGQKVTIRRRGKKPKRIRHFESYYARLNLKRSRGRTAITVLSLVMSITVFVALQSFTKLLDASQAVQKMYPGDYAVTNETVGIPGNGVEELKSNDMVESLSTVCLSVFRPEEPLPFETDLSLLSHETLHLAALDEKQLLSGADNLTEDAKEALLNGEACLVKNPIVLSYEDTVIEHTNLKTGDTITIDGRTLKVAGIREEAVSINNEGFLNGVQIITNNEVYQSILDKDTYSEVYPTLSETADPEVFENWLTQWSGHFPGTHWLSYLESDAQMAESFGQIRMLCWGLILFIGVIGLLNIINTVYSSIYTRIGEIGMQRAIGMSIPSLYRTFLWEGAYYGIFSSVIGALLGYVCCVFINAAQTDSLQLVAVPVGTILQASAVSVLACLAATAVPLRGIADMDIVRAIGHVE